MILANKLYGIIVFSKSKEYLLAPSKLLSSFLLLLPLRLYDFIICIPCNVDKTSLVSDT